MKAAYLLPKGFLSAGIYGGLKKSKKPDMGLIYSVAPCDVAAFYTKNKLKSAHIIYDKNADKGKIHAVFANSGNANALNGMQGLLDAAEITRTVEETLCLEKGAALLASTGKISKKMPMETIINHIPKLVRALSDKDKNFPKAIMTTDLTLKVKTISLNLGGKTVVITGAAKGSGMISPNMATMLAFVMTDAAIDKKLLHSAAKEAVDLSFNRVTVDGDMSPNDTLFLMANGLAGNKKISKQGKEYGLFKEAVFKICYALAEDMNRDGEGATKFVKITVQKAAGEKQAAAVARAIANSPLVKTCFFGGSLNPGRIISAAGASLEDIDIEKLELKINGVVIIKSGEMAMKNAGKAAVQMKKKELMIDLCLNTGKAEYYLLTTDFSFDYVKINADYN